MITKLTDEHFSKYSILNNNIFCRISFLFDSVRFVIQIFWMICGSAYGHSQIWPGLCCVELFYVILLDCYKEGNFLQKINIYIKWKKCYPGMTKALTLCN